MSSNTGDTVECRDLVISFSECKLSNGIISARRLSAQCESITYYICSSTIFKNIAERLDMFLYTIETLPPFNDGNLLRNRSPPSEREEHELLYIGEDVEEVRGARSILISKYLTGVCGMMK